MRPHTGLQALTVMETMEAIGRGEKAVIYVPSKDAKDRLLRQFPLLPPDAVTFKDEHGIPKGSARACRAVYDGLRGRIGGR
jgi:hypothetical protein